VPKLNPELDAEFKDLFEEAIKLSPGFQLLDADTVKEDPNSPNFTTFESKIEEMVWQGFIYGLRLGRKYEVIFKVTCSDCELNSITETSEGEVINHELALEEGWVWNFDEQNWSCPDCASGN